MFLNILTKILIAYVNNYTNDCLKILDNACSNYELKIKEAMHINWGEPELNAQVNHYNISITILFLFTYYTKDCSEKGRKLKIKKIKEQRNSLDQLF